MPYIVVVYTSPNHNEKTIKSVFVYNCMKIVCLHSKGLLGYYDLRKKKNTRYITYKSFFSLREITWKQYYIFNSLYRSRLNNEIR